MQKKCKKPTKDIKRCLSVPATTKQDQKIQNLESAFIVDGDTLHPTHHKPQSPSKNEQATGIGQWIFLEELFTAVDSAAYASIVCKESENNNIHK